MASYTPLARDLRANRSAKKQNIKKFAKNTESFREKMRHSRPNFELFMYQSNHLSSKRGSFGGRDRMVKSFKGIKDRKIKTRNLGIKNNSLKNSNSQEKSSKVILRFNKTSNLSLKKSKHKRSTTS